VTWPDVRTAGLLAACGLPAWEYLTTSDTEKRLLLAGVARATVEVRETFDRNLASYVIEALARATRRG
jgi:hypothetical protein